MTKCGSTLAFEMARTALELSGFPQEKLPIGATGVDRKINFAQHLDDNNIAEMTDAVRDIGHPIVVKTHTRPDLGVIEMINRGEAIVQASYRDPREMALSMMDHGQRSRSVGKLAFSEIETLDDALINISSQIDSLTQWLYRENCLPLYYEDIAFSSNKTMRRILAQLEISAQPAPIVRHVIKNRFIQLNMGVKRRYRTEMSYDDQRRFKRAFRPFYMRLIRHRDFLANDGTAPLRDGILLVNPKKIQKSSLSSAQHYA